MTSLSWILRIPWDLLKFSSGNLSIGPLRLRQGRWIVVAQGESFHYHTGLIAQVLDFALKIFPICGYYYTLVPTYPSGLIGFTFCSKHYSPLETIDLKRAALLDNLRYYSPDVHKAAFVLPEFVNSASPGASRSLKNFR